MDLPDSTSTVRVVAIASDDSWTHVYQSFDQLLAHNDADETPLGAVEFFDDAGRRLATVFDARWGLAGLEPTAQPPAPDRLHGRLQAVLRHVADYLRDNPQVAASLPDLPDDFEKRLTELATGSLDNIISTLELQPAGGVVPMHSAGVFHNALHAAGWTHD